MNDPETERLLTAAVAGNPQAVDALLLRHRSRLKRAIVVYLDPRLSARIDASDVLQDALAKATEKLPHYLRHRPIDFYPWIRQLVRDQLVDTHRRHIQAARRTIRRETLGPAQTNESSTLQLADQLVGSATSPSAIAGLAERRHLVRHALAQLPSADQEVLLMRFVEQLSVPEIAQILAISEAAAKSRLRRSLEKMYRVVNLHDSGGQCIFRSKH